MANWLIPDNFADILPQQARTLEKLRRDTLDLFVSHGFELVQPPMVEFVDSLLTGSGSDLDNNTFKFMDQAGGRMIGLRADMTPQAARIDAHILNRSGVSRLCYAGSCIHARPMHPLASREPVVAGAELFGASGIEADAQIMTLAVETLRKLGVSPIHIDIGHTGVLRALVGDNPNENSIHALVRALRMKDPVALAQASVDFDLQTQQALQVLVRNFGDESVLDVLEHELPDRPGIREAIEEVRTLAKMCGADEYSFDFCDVHGYQYLTGITFSVNIQQYAQAILRGGRYDGVGLAFGRSRPACGFTIYLRALAGVSQLQLDAHPQAVVAREPFDHAYRQKVEELRSAGKIVIGLLPGEKLEDVQKQFRVTHELVRAPSGIELVTLQTKE